MSEIILINLGTNDFAHGTPDKEGFMDAYRYLLNNLRNNIFGVPNTNN